MNLYLLFYRQNNKEARILLTEYLAFTTDNKKFMSTWERRKIKKTDFFGKGKSFVKSCDIFLLFMDYICYFITLILPTVNYFLLLKHYWIDNKKVISANLNEVPDTEEVLGPAKWRVAVSRELDLDIIFRELKFLDSHTT